MGDIAWIFALLKDKKKSLKSMKNQSLGDYIHISFCSKNIRCISKNNISWVILHGYSRC